MNVASAGQNDACIDREDPSIRKAFSENFCSHGIVFIAETGKKDTVIGKIKIDIAGGKAFPGFPLIFASFKIIAEKIFFCNTDGMLWNGQLVNYKASSLRVNGMGEKIKSVIANLPSYLSGLDPDSRTQLAQLNQLSSIIAKMDSRERNIYAGALDGNSINDLNDMIRVAEQVSDYILIPNVNSDVTLGRYVAVAGQIQGDPRFPEAAWPYLDFAKIGAEYYAEHGGAYTYAGYVLRKQNDELVREKKSKIQLGLSSSQAQVSVCLPATKEELERVKRTLGIDCFAEEAVTKVSFSMPYMDEHIPTTGVCVEDANELAWAIEGMQCEDGELLKYLSVLSVEQPGTMQEALRCAMNLDDYERIPEDTYEYGQAVLRRIGADDELIDTIDGYMDFEKLGEDTMAEEGVRRTEFGLIRRCSSPFAEETQAMEMGGLS